VYDRLRQENALSTAASWISHPPLDTADVETASALDKVKRADGSVHNLYKPFVHRPDLLVLADRFYRDLLHNPRRTLEPWLQELIATYVAQLNGCAYAARHHGANFRVLLGDETLASELLSHLKPAGVPDIPDPRIKPLFLYVHELTLRPAGVGRNLVDSMLSAGFSDAQIFEVNQIASNFAYWTRVINGLGISLGAESVGIYSEASRTER